MASVENEIWNIFTFYTLHGNPLDPEHIRCTQFVKLARDCQIVGTTLSEADPPLLEADIQVAYTAEVKNRGGNSTSLLQKMNYNDFLTALMKLAIKVYPRSRTVDEAFQRLLMDNVLPLASRRCPDNISMFLESEDVQRLFSYYSDALEGIFTFYATSDKRSQAALIAGAVKAGHVVGPFAASHALTVGGRSPARATRTVNTMKEAMGYPEFLKFATDFDLSSSVILSTLELGDIYLSSIKTTDHESTIRKLTFPEFWEALVRCALVAYSKISDSSVLDKIRGLFLYMWRAINRSVPRAFNERRNVSTYAGDLLAGAMLFNKRFTAAWAADGYRDYLSPDAPPLESGKAVLTRLLRKGGGGGMGASGELDSALLAGGSSGSAGLTSSSGAYLGMPEGAPAAYLSSGSGAAAGSPAGPAGGSSGSAGGGGVPRYFGSGLVVDPATGNAMLGGSGRAGGGGAPDYGY